MIRQAAAKVQSQASDNVQGFNFVCITKHICTIPCRYRLKTGDWKISNKIQTEADQPLANMSKKKIKGLMDSSNFLNLMSINDWSMQAKWMPFPHGFMRIWFLAFTRIQSAKCSNFEYMGRKGTARVRHSLSMRSRRSRWLSVQRVLTLISSRRASRSITL